MFLRETECQLSIKSPFVVAMYGLQETQTAYYMLIELSNGGTLTSFIEKRGNYLKENEARLLIRQIVLGMAALHE